MTDRLHTMFCLREVYQSDYIRIEVDESRQFMYIVWLCHPESDELRACLLLEAEITHEYGCKYWLSDARKVNFFDYADQNWLLQEVVPILKQEKLLKVARVITKESYLLMDAHRIFQKIEADEEVRSQTKLELFVDIDTALDWLFEEGDYI